MSHMIPMISMALLVGSILPIIASAQPGRSEVTEGNRLYDENRFDEAHEQYLAALRAAPDSSIAPFNDGNALYRTGEFQRAIEAFQQAAERDDPAIDGQAWYNLSNHDHLEMATTRGCTRVTGVEVTLILDFNGFRIQVR